MAMAHVPLDAVPAAPGVFTWPSDEPQLIGSRCSKCGIITFPAQGSCPRCGSDEMAQQLLSRNGTLWAWTTQSFPPPSPPYVGPVGDDFVPYGLGFVELPGEVRVESRLTTADPDQLRVGMPMRLTVIPFGTDEGGHPRVTFAFEPAEGAA